MTRLALIFTIFCLTLKTFGQNVGINNTPFDKTTPAKANKDLQVYIYAYQQFVAQNYYPESDFLKGQIVGRLFGGNTTQTSDSLTSMYAEQRAIPFFVYTPKIFDGKAIIRASFEIDWTWGDVNYGVGGNAGSAISGDQVNLQTQNLEVEYRPGNGWAINAGLQRMFDTPNDPYRTLFDKFTTTAYRLAYWGTDGVGVSVRKDADLYKIKGGYYKLYENNVELNDDVTLMELSGQYNLSPKWNAGASAYYVRDRSNGKGGISILGQGPASQLANYNGTYRFPLSPDPFHCDVVWLGGFFGRNEDMMLDRWFTTGFVNANLGSITQKAVGETKYKKTVSISGIAANIRSGYRYGQTTGDAITADVVYTSGNKDGISDGKYTGVMTGNTWGSPGGIFIGHGAYLLFPHGNVVNRFMAAVTDLSNVGYGITGGTINVSKDLIPNKLHAKVGGAFGLSNITPAKGGNIIGYEGNAKLSYDLGPFMSIEAHGAYLALGNFYDSPSVNGNKSSRPVNPWTAFTCFKWLIF